MSYTTVLKKQRWRGRLDSEPQKLLPSKHRGIMPLKIAAACATWYHGGICQSGERRMSGHLYTSCGSLGVNHAITPTWVCYRTFLSAIDYFIVTSCKCSWQWLAQCCLGFYLISNCHGVQMPAHPPLSTLANAIVASSGTSHCYPEWHNFPVIWWAPSLNKGFHSLENWGKQLEIMHFVKRCNMYWLGSNQWPSNQEACTLTNPLMCFTAYFQHALNADHKQFGFEGI